MANRKEMITWLKQNHPSMCECQKIDELPTHDIDTTGSPTVHRLYIDYHGGVSTWDTMTKSESKQVLDIRLVLIDLFQKHGLGILRFGVMNNGWIHAAKTKIGRVSISSGGVVQIKGSPFNSDMKLLDNKESIEQSIIEAAEKL